MLLDTSYSGSTTGTTTATCKFTALCHNFNTACHRRLCHRNWFGHFTGIDVDWRKFSEDSRNFSEDI